MGQSEVVLAYLEKQKCNWLEIKGKHMQINKKYLCTSLMTALNFLNIHNYADNYIWALLVIWEESYL